MKLTQTMVTVFSVVLRIDLYKHRKFMDEYTYHDHYFSEKRIAVALLVIIMVLTGVALRVGFGLPPTTPSTTPMTTSTTTPMTTPTPAGISKNYITPADSH